MGCRRRFCDLSRGNGYVEKNYELPARPVYTKKDDNSECARLFLGDGAGGRLSL
jgi:hypothetical protein